VQGTPGRPVWPGGDRSAGCVGGCRAEPSRAGWCGLMPRRSGGRGAAFGAARPARCTGWGRGWGRGPRPRGPGRVCGALRGAAGRCGGRRDLRKRGGAVPARAPCGAGAAPSCWPRRGRHGAECAVSSVAAEPEPGVGTTPRDGEPGRGGARQVSRQVSPPARSPSGRRHTSAVVARGSGPPAGPRPRPDLGSPKLDQAGPDPQVLVEAQDPPALCFWRIPTWSPCWPVLRGLKQETRAQ
jgi:hypothetical protein